MVFYHERYETEGKQFFFSYVVARTREIQSHEDDEWF